jgi:hypothetical protein
MILPPTDKGSAMHVSCTRQQDLKSGLALLAHGSHEKTEGYFPRTCCSKCDILIPSRL